LKKSKSAPLAQVYWKIMLYAYGAADRHFSQSVNFVVLGLGEPAPPAQYAPAVV
jgi:hypothetical protein